MKLAELSPEEMKEMSMLEIAYLILQEERQALNFYDLCKKVAETKGLSQEEVDKRIAQFYTDINIDGRFLCLGENRWGLRHWYPYDQIDEEITSAPKPKKKKKKAKKVEDDFDDYDEDYEDYDEDDVDTSDNDNDNDNDDDEDYDDDDSKDDSDDDYDEDLVDEDEFELDEDLDDDDDDEEFEDDEKGDK